MDPNLNIREEETDVNFVTENDLFRKDSDLFFREKSSYDESVNIDSLFLKDYDDDSDEEQVFSNSEKGSSNSEIGSSNPESSSSRSGPNDQDVSSSSGPNVQDVSSSSTSDTDCSIPKDYWFSNFELSSKEVKAPNSNKTAFWIPNVPEQILPRIGMIFPDLNKGIDFYFAYARIGGFDARLGSVKYTEVGTKDIKYRYVLCSRAGTAEGCSSDSLKGETSKQKRKYPSQMIECPAKICFRMLESSGRCYIVTFEPSHNHELYTKSTIHMSRSKRKMDYFDQTLSWQLYQANIGSVRSHGIVSAFKGGLHKQGAKKVDFKNFSRDLNCYMKDSDANLLFNMLEKRAESVPGFSFYHLVEDSELRGLFWADSIAKRNYKEFCDVISFDATYRTNKYNLIFVPFTGIDNHQRCVSFGAALIAQETEEYYTWLLRSFLGAFGKQPSVVVTDQDRAMRNAVETVFTESKHRLCMWHIGKKLTVKVSTKVIKETDFLKRMNNLIWNSCIDPLVFEDKWNSLVAEHQLNDNKWLKKMYSLRSSWIPAYFKDLPLSGLMRTTSRSESENYFFQSFMSNTTNLLLFMIKFDAAMDKQRSIQAESDFNSVNKRPPLQTRLEFEVQASRFYTHKIFQLFQREVQDCVYTCSVGNCTSVDGHESITVLEQIMGAHGENRSVFFNAKSCNFRSVNTNQFQYEVKFFPREEFFKCSCMVFEHFGYLCRHVLCVMKSRFRSEIPSKYLISRWQKGVIRAQELEKCYFTGEDVGGCHSMVQDAYRVIADCVNVIAHDPDSLSQYIQWQKEIRCKIEANPPNRDTRKKADVISSMIGIKKLDKVTIRNPTNVRFKGSGSGATRMQGQREVALNKEGRTCTYCRKKIPPSQKHDWRTCPVRIADEKRKASEAAGVNTNHI